MMLKSKLQLLTACLSLIAVLFVASQVDAQSQESYIDQKYQDYCYEIAGSAGISPEILIALIEVESGGDANAIGPDNDTGLCQIIPKFSKYSQKELLDPYTNITAAVEILADYSTRYEISDALAAYNMGEYSKTFKKIKGTGEMTDYAKKIMKRAYELEDAAGKHICN